jgi:hypothetical protein
MVCLGNMCVDTLHKGDDDDDDDSIIIIIILLSDLANPIFQKRIFFFLWYCLKAKAHETLPASIYDFKQRIPRCIESIPT